MIDTPHHTSPPARRGARLAAGALALLSAGAGLGALAPTAAASTASVEVVFPDGSKVLADNLTGGVATAANITTLVKKADNSMGTTNPTNFPKARGQMSNGDRVVVTPSGLYWLDRADRGGLLSGMWALKKTGGTFDFADYPKKGWSPNYLLPGSDGNATARPFDTGQYVSVIPKGGADGSCTPGVGKFVVGSSNLCGKELPAQTSGFAASGGLYTLTGSLYQAGTGDTTMRDSLGNESTVDFALTYRFTSAAVTTGLVLTPATDINLATVVVGGVTDYATSPYAPKSYSVSNKNRVHLTDPETQAATGCGPTREVAAFSLAKLCTGNANGTNFVITNTNSYGGSVVTNGPLAVNDYVTARQKGDATSAQRQLTYRVVGDSVIPQSIDHVWNKSVGVVALDADFVNDGLVAASKESPFKGAFEITMAGVPR